MLKDELISKIKNANKAYASGIPFMTDYEYDKLWKALYSIDPTNQVLYHTSRDPNLTEGIINHIHPVYGTNKAFNIDDLKPFMSRFGDTELTIEPKYDGCAGVLTHMPNGLRLVLEGDGIKGLDVTRHLNKLTINFEPKNNETVEIIIPCNKWNPDYGANPRNTIAGWLNRYKFPDYYAEIISHNYGKLKQQYKFDGNYDLLEELLLSLYNKWSKQYPMDGLMLKVTDEQRRIIAGNNGVANSWSIAWKPPIQVKTTIVTAIEWNVSRLGRVIPTIIYEPIELCGTTNQRVTGNNAVWFVTKGITVGSKIIVGKAGEIIPKIIDVLTVKNVVGKNQHLGQGKNENFNSGAFHGTFHGVSTGQGVTVPTTTDGPQTENFGVPSVCPICETELEWEGVHLICRGTKCIAQLIKTISYFYSDKAMDIKGIGPAAIEKLLYDPECFDVLSEKPWALLDPVTYNIYHRLAVVLSETARLNILDSVSKTSKQKNAAHFITGLGLEKVGYKTAKNLYNYIKFGKLNSRISKEAQKNFVKGITILNSMIKEINYFAFADVPKPADITYCITGTLTMSRDDMINLLEKVNWEFNTAVTTTTDFLIVGESPGKVKTTMAKKHNINIINENELMEIIGGQTNA